MSTEIDLVTNSDHQGSGHEGEINHGHQHGENVKRLKTNLTEMTIVDRNLKPHYILESAPRLSRLTIDWQQVNGKRLCKIICVESREWSEIM